MSEVAAPADDPDGGDRMQRFIRDLWAALVYSRELQLNGQATRYEFRQVIQHYDDGADE